MQSEVVDAVTSLDVSGRGELDVTGIVELAYRHEGLSPGNDSSAPSVGAPGDMVTPPPDFDRDLDYGRFGAGLRYDTRDTEGRPSRGMAVAIAGSMVQELSGANFSAFGASAGIDWYLPVLPNHRAFIARAGVSMTAPFLAGHDIPLHALTVLGRKQHLRGYGSDRFHDRHGWWASAAYRFPLYEYVNTGVAVDAEVFVEAGNVASSLTGLVDGPIAYDGGVALRAGYDAANFFELELGVSPEGPVLGFSVGKSL
jgi:outer membrane protein assembly factor BamA